MNEWRTVDIACLDFSKSFGTISHNVFIGKPRKCGLDEQTARWIENRLNSRSPRVMMVAQGLVGGLSLVVSLKVPY